MAALGETNAAAFVQWPDGRQGVLTRTRYPIEHLTNVSEILDMVRARGIPVPRYELITEFQGWSIIVQERLPGAPLAGRHIDLPMMEAILALNASFAELLRHRPDVPSIGTAASRPKYAALDGYDVRTRELLARIREIQETSNGPADGHDLVQGDFSLPNILFDKDGNLTGIVDWHDHTLYRGDRRFCLVPLRFDIAWSIVRGWATVDPVAVRLLDEALDTIEPAILQLYWTRPSVNLLGAMIQEGRHADIDHLLTIAWSRLLPR
jgi:aminoglycoside phosphotransferase